MFEVVIFEADNVSFQFYADHTQVYVTMNDLSETKEKLTQVHDAVCCWMHNRKLKLNPGKTEFLLIKPTRNDQLTLPDSLLFGESSVEGFEWVSNLGFIFDSGIHFKKQIQEVNR